MLFRRQTQRDCVFCLVYRCRVLVVLTILHRESGDQQIRGCDRGRRWTNQVIYNALNQTLAGSSKGDVACKRQADIFLSASCGRKYLMDGSHPFSFVIIAIQRILTNRRSTHTKRLVSDVLHVNSNRHNTL